MKTMNIKNLLLAGTVCCGFSAAITSCTDLDSDKYFGDRKTLESVFTDEIQANQWLAHAYSFLDGSNFEVCSKGETGNGGGGSWNPFNFADDMYYGDRDNTLGDSKDGDYAKYNSFHEGNYSEAVGQSAWVRCYQGIYQASIFIHNIGMNKKMTKDQVEDYRGQARFVRAYYYWLLLRKFGPVPIMADEGADYTLEYEDLATPRSTYEECATYIADQMLQAAKELKYYSRDESNCMRPTIGAALATRAIVLTYAASPLANGQLKNGQHPANVTDDVAKQLKNFDGTPLLSLTYDESKWARAAAACKDVIDLGVYDLYTDGFDDQTEGGDYPKSIAPPYDEEFSNQNWPNGWKNIDPYKSYCKLFNGAVSPANNPELIFTRGNMNKNDHDNGIGSLVLHSMPVSLKGWNTHGLTQKMVDTYYMNDGSDVDGMYREWRQPGDGGNDRPRPEGFITRDEARANAYPEVPVWHQGSSSTQMSQKINIAKQYVSREPRFYASVAYSGSVWQMLDHSTPSLMGIQITYYRSSDSNEAATSDGYKNNFSYLRTGIGVKKYYNPHDWINKQNEYDHICEKYEPAIRYADILLMYAECLNELTEGLTFTMKNWQGNDVTITGRNLQEMKRGIRPVRIRAGLPDYTDAEYSSQNDLRAKIKRERMIEFMGEGKRYFDLRRWMDAPVEENKRIYGLNIFMTSQHREEFMQVIPVYNLSATFTDKMYFWPISFTDLKRNKNLVQNPGWKYND